MKMKNCIRKLIFLGIILFGSSLLAQTTTGTVSDDEGPLAGVNVIIEGTSIGTSTDFDGNYNISNVDANAVLVFSYIGYETLRIPANGKPQINVSMTQGANALDEVVLVGYSTLKKSTLTGAVSVVDVDDLGKARTSNVAQALQGQVAGVQVASSSGAPGGGIQVRVRGVGTIGNNDPLYIVDGVPSRDITFLNQSDIKTMSVLKDAAAASIYGSRASAGVVLITTKSGSIGKMRIEVDHWYGVQSASNLPTMLNAEQYINTTEKAVYY